MEIYNFCNAAGSVLFAILKDTQLALTWGLIIGAVLLLVLFVLQGFGLFAMAKGQGCKHAWLSFIPFANIYYMGKLAGECSFFGQKMRYAGVFALIAQVLAFVVSVLSLLAEWYLYTYHGAPQISAMDMPFWTGLTGFSLTVANFYNYSIYFLSIADLLSRILLIILLMGLYKKYAPQNNMILALFSFMIPMARFVTIFVLRNRKPIDYEAYMRARREAYMRRQQYYNGYGNSYNPYGDRYNRPPQDGYYGNSQNGYGQNGYNGQEAYQPQKQQDPFEEFASSQNEGNKVKDDDEFFGDSDDFFN